MRKKNKINIGDIAIKAVGISAGAVGGELLSAKLLTNVNATLKGGGKMALGAIGPVLMPGNKIVESIGDGLIAGGSIELAKSVMPAAFMPAVEGVGRSMKDMAYVIDEDFEQVNGSSGEYDSSVGKDPNVVAGDGADDDPNVLV